MNRFWQILFLGFLFLNNPKILAATESVTPVSREQIQLSFAPVVKKVSPAVVNIYAVRVVNAQPVSPFFDDPLFKHFFGNALPFGSPHARIQKSLGSGVLVRADGVVIN